MINILCMCHRFGLRFSNAPRYSTNLKYVLYLGLWWWMCTLWHGKNLQQECYTWIQKRLISIKWVGIHPLATIRASWKLAHLKLELCRTSVNAHIFLLGIDSYLYGTIHISTCRNVELFKTWYKMWIEVLGMVEPKVGKSIIAPMETRYNPTTKHSKLHIPKS